MAQADDNFGHVCKGVEHMDQDTNLKTVIANTVGVIIFLGAFCFGGYILCNYLLSNARVKQWTMIIFYALTLVVILGRISFLVFSCFRVQTDIMLYYLSSLTTLVYILAGATHSHNLSSLIFDLASVNCKTKEEKNKLKGRRVYFKILLFFWGLASIWEICILVVGENTLTALSEMILFFVLILELFIINCWLLQLLNQLFGKDTFSKEKNFLIFTSIFFSLSYFVQVSLNVTIFSMLEIKGDSVTQKLCKSNFVVSITSISVFLITEWLPFMIIYTLNYRNFRTIDQKKYEFEAAASEGRSQAVDYLQNLTQTSRTSENFVMDTSLNQNDIFDFPAQLARNRKDEGRLITKGNNQIDISMSVSIPNETLGIDYEHEDGNQQSRSQSYSIRVAIKDVIRMRESGWIGYCMYRRYSSLVSSKHSQKSQKETRTTETFSKSKPYISPIYESGEIFAGSIQNSNESHQDHLPKLGRSSIASSIN